MASIDTNYNTDNSNQKRKFSDGSSAIENEGEDKEKPDWKKLKMESKQRKEKRKMGKGSNNEIYDISIKAKKIWEELRRDDCKADRQKELCDELFSLIKGKVKGIIYAHDTVRVVETLLAAGGEKYRTLLFDELKEDILNLSKCTYSKFLVLKLLKCGTKDQKDTVMKAMQGHVVELIKHKIACEVLEYAYNDCANAKQRSNIIQEFYGPQFKYFKEEVCTLEEVIKKYPDKRKTILADMYKIIMPVIEKGVFTNTIIHTLLKEFLLECDETERSAIIDSLKEGLLPILHTRDGSRVAMLCLWHGTAKERKIILKSFKEKFVKIALEEHGHMVLFAAFDCVDDIVILKKVVLNELLEHIDEISASEIGRKMLRYLVAPRSKLFFHPHVLKVLEIGDSIGKFKKERESKYKDIHGIVSSSILKLIHKNLDYWVKDPHWTLFIGAAIQNLDGEYMVVVFEEMARIFNEPYVPNSSYHFLEISYTTKMISFIISGDKQRHLENKPVFSTPFLKGTKDVIESFCLSNRGCFVLIKMIETEIKEVVEEVIQVCSPLQEKLSKLDFAGAKILVEKLNKK